MLSNYFTLRCIALHLDGQLRGKRIAAAFSQEKDTLAIMFHDFPAGLVVSCRPESNMLYLHRSFARAKRNTVDILGACLDKTIESISIHPSDRIIRFALNGGLSLYAQFFAVQANVMLVDHYGKILDAFKGAKKLVGRVYEVTHPAPQSGLSLTQMMNEHPDSTKVEQALKSVLPTFGAMLIRELLFRSGLQPTSTIAQLSSPAVERLTEMTHSLLAELADPHPRVYAGVELHPFQVAAHDINEGAGSVTFSVVALHHLPPTHEHHFDDVHDAVHYCLARRGTRDVLTQRKRVLHTTLCRQADKTQRTIRALEQDLSKHDRPSHWERLGSLLMANLGLLAKGARTITLTDGEGPTEIALDPSVSPVENAQRYFAKAKRSRQAQEDAHARLKEQKARLRVIESLLTALDELQTKDEFTTFVDDHGPELETFGLGADRPVRPALPFRTFIVDGGFEVLAGKSGANNDLLTTKYAKPNDLWFHARGSSGSHVVLKVGSGRGEPSKRAKEQAAAIAAYYSKMKKAKLVPVAVTERKYVRKPKGAPPGTVVLEREKVIFAEPGLPHSKQS